MLLKRILAGLLCAVILAGGVYYGVTFRFFDRPLTAKAQAELESRIALPDNFTLTAAADCTGTANNALQAARENLRTGVHALELSVAFDAHNVPYLADGPDSITDESVALEKILRDNEKNESVRYLLNVRNLVPLQTLQKMLQKHNLLDRVILCGISPENAKKSRSSLSAFRLCADIDNVSVDLKDAQACRAWIHKCINAGATYIRCSADDVTKELSGVLKSGMVDLIIDQVHTDYEMYYALSLNPRVIVTDRPAEMYTLLYANDYLRVEMQNPY